MSRHWLIAVVVSGSAALVASPADAQAPWLRLNLFKHVEADPNADYSITEKSGPWMIMAATFADNGLRGGGETQARALVLELRGKHNLPAYVHRKSFDHSKTVDGLGVDPWNRPRKMKNMRSVQSDEYAVLVGNYAAVDDPTAQKDLEKIKYIYPAALRPSDKGKTNQQLAWLHNLERQVTRQRGQGQPKGPMGRAFVTANPLLPAQFFAHRGLDQFVEDMNKGVKHSLLECPGKYTVLVATFKGDVIIDQQRIEEIERGKRKAKNSLTGAAEKAHRVCESLREKGYEAYIFHDRSASMVTVGSFDSIGTPLAKGKTELNPTVFRIMQLFSGTDVRLPENLVYKQAYAPALGKRPKELDGIQLDLQPMPVSVPKRSAASYVSR